MASRAKGSRYAAKDLTIGGMHAVCSPAQGLALAAGKAQVTGTLAVTTGLNSITGAVASLDANAALTGEFVTCTFSGGTLTIAVWKPTGSGDVTPIASTTAVNVGWIAFGS